MEKILGFFGPVYNGENEERTKKNEKRDNFSLTCGHLTT